MVTRREFTVRTLGTAAALVALNEGFGLGAAPPVTAQTTGAPASAAWQARRGLSPSDYQTTFNQLTSQGYRLTDISGYTDGSDVLYAAIWQQYDSPNWVARNGLSAADYQTQFDQLAGQGFRAVRVNAFEANGTVLYNGIWEQSSVADWKASHVLSAADYQTMFDQLAGQGFRLADLSGYELGGQPYYAGIWVLDGGPNWQAHHGLTADQYQSTFDQLADQGMYPVHVSGYGVGGTAYYAAIWEQTSNSPAARHGLTDADYQGVFDQWRYQGFRATRTCGYVAGGQTLYAAIFENVGLSSGDLSTIQNTVAGVLQKNNVPGAQIAIAKDGRLVYAAGFGNLDSAGNAVAPTNVFRIASITKAITSTTILHLLEQNKLNLTDTVFGSSGILGTMYGTKAYTSNMQAITLDQLLHHTGGGWTNDNTDPMFKHTDYSQAQLIGWVLDNTTDGTGGSSMYHLATPGTKYAYSNFGYCVLGRVIEKLTGQSYETYVQQNILSQCGISNMNIAGNTLADRRSDETQYFGANGDDPYNMNVARMDSHGGWVVSAIDYVRFMVRVDGFPTKPDILSSADITAMTTGSSVNSNYAMGWALTPPNWWHNGSLPGTQTIMVRTPDGFCWAALFNSRAGSSVGNDQDNMMWKIHDSVTSWPSFDLF